MNKLIKEHQQRMQENRIWKKVIVPILIFTLAYFGGHVVYWFINK